MPPQTRSSTRTPRAATRASVAQTQASGETKASKNTSTSNQKSEVAPKPKSKLNPKTKTNAKQDSVPAPKRFRKSTSKHDVQGGKARGVELLVNLPVEILVEIARGLHLLDLLMLSRVNKFLRELLADKYSARIWRSARENIPGLPACPEEVSESYYAAILLAKKCSSCGGYAPREMIPVLMVRLCSDCWEDELVEVRVVTDPSLVPVISAPAPRQGQNWMVWCSYNDAREVKLKLDEFNQAGDKEALRQWKEERRKLVAARKRSAEPLSKWLEKRKQEREQIRKDLKTLRQEEIESRLIQLGWERGDFKCHNRQRSKQWNSMVQTTKAITDKVWGNLLPRLINILELNRKEHLERERAWRRERRMSVVSDWFKKTVTQQLPEYARATPVKGGHPGAEKMLSKFGDLDFESSVSIRKAFPTMIQVYDWPEYLTLIDGDIPTEQYEAEFEEKTSELRRAVDNWARGLESQLITILPDGMRIPDFDTFPLTMTIVTGESSQPIDTLPEGTQKLLRGDAIFNFGYYSQLYFYPDSFVHSADELARITLDTTAHEIAQALLIVLGIADAPYLSLKALGRAFWCGRCPQAVALRYNWEGIIYHYLEALRSWNAVTRKLQVQSDESFVYVCVHDVKQDDPDRPLVRMSTRSTPTNGRYRTYPGSACLLCRSANLESRMTFLEVVDHVRFVHLVREPEAGVHYKV